MDTVHKPFFSRKQITGILWFSLIAILVLSSLGPGKVEYQQIEHNKAKTVYWMNLDKQPLTLTLLLPAAPALSENQRQLQQLKAVIIRQRMQNLSQPNYSFSVVPRQDRIELNLQWANEQTMPDLEYILERLKAPVDTQRWIETLADIEARHYLENQFQEQQLINEFFAQLQTENRPVLEQLGNAYAQQFEQVRFALSGEDAEDYADTLSERFAATTQPRNSAVVATTVTQNINIPSDRSRNYQLLTGSTIPPRQDKRFVEYRVAAQVIQDLLSEYQSQHNLQYRMLWSALDSFGYQALIVGAEQNPGPILTQLKYLISEDLVERSKQHLIEQWQERMREHRNQALAMNLVAFYGLEADTLQNYAEDIDDLDEDDIITLAQAALETNQHINILLTPAR